MDNDDDEVLLDPEYEKSKILRFLTTKTAARTTIFTSVLWDFACFIFLIWLCKNYIDQSQTEGLWFTIAVFTLKFFSIVSGLLPSLLPTEKPCHLYGYFLTQIISLGLLVTSVILFIVFWGVIELYAEGVTMNVRLYMGLALGGLITWTVLNLIASLVVVEHFLVLKKSQLVEQNSESEPLLE